MSDPSLRTYALRADRFRVLVSGEGVGGRYSVVETVARRGSELPIHVHSSEDELLLVLEGDMCVRVGRTEQRLAAGDALRLRRGVPHALRLETDTARLLTVYCPAGFENYLETVGEPVSRLEATPGRADSPDVPRLLLNARPYGLEYFPAQED